MWTPEDRPYDRSGLRYPSDLPGAEWDLVRPYILASTRASSAPERMREIVNAAPYIVSMGCQRRALPKDLPPRSTVHGWFVCWHCDGVLDRLPLLKSVRRVFGGC